MIESVAGIVLHNLRNNDPEWRFQVGYLAELMKLGSDLSPRAKSALRKHLPSLRNAQTREEWVTALEQEENKLN